LSEIVGRDSPFAGSALSRSASGASGIVVELRPTTGLAPPRLSEIWQYRELCYFLVWRDLKVRYAQTKLGAAWTVLQPLAMLLVFLLAFRKVARVETSVPYAVFALAGVTLWMFVSRSVLNGANSLLSNIDLLTKTSCPRLLIPVMAVLSGFVDFVVALALFLALAASFGVFPTWRFVFVPVFLLVTLVATLGISLLLAALNVRYRDVRQSLPFLIQLWLFASPIAYPLHFHGVWSTLLSVNPMVGLVEGFRWAVAATAAPDATALVLSIAVSVLLCALAVVHFASMERTFADEA